MTDVKVTDVLNAVEASEGLRCANVIFYTRKSVIKMNLDVKISFVGLIGGDSKPLCRVLCPVRSQVVRLSRQQPTQRPLNVYLRIIRVKLYDCHNETKP